MSPLNIEDMIMLSKIKKFLSRYINDEINDFSRTFDTYDKKERMGNNLLMRLLPISSFCFFFLNTNFHRHFIGVFVAWMFFKYFFKKVPDFIDRLYSSSLGLRCFAFVSSLGICVGEFHCFYSETTINGEE